MMNFLSPGQCDALAALVEDGRRFDQVIVHPYSGVATFSRDLDRVLVERDGVIAYDSTEPRS